MFRAILTAAVIAALYVIAPSSALAERWIKAESDNFVIYSSTDEKSTLAYAASLEDFHRLTDYFYTQIGDSQLPVTNKTRFNLMKKSDEFRHVTPKIEEGAFSILSSCEDGSQYFSVSQINDYNNMMARDLISGMKIDLSLLYFSFNNARVTQYFEKSPPNWVRTGLNLYFMTATIKDGKAVLGKPAPTILFAYDNYVLAQGTESFFADIVANRQLPKGEEGKFWLYNWIMMSYFMSTEERREDLVDYIRLVKDGVDSLEAFRKATGFEPEYFDTVLKTYKTSGVPLAAYAIKASEVSEVSVTQLPDYESPVPLLDAATRLCPTEPHTRRIIAQLQKDAELYPEDVMVQGALARANIRNGTPEASRAWLTRRVAEAPDDAEARLLMGQMYLALAKIGPVTGIAENYAAARKELGRAYKLNPGSAPILYYTALAHEDRPDYPSDNNVMAAELAQSYSGGGYSIYLAELAVRRGDYEKAMEYFPKPPFTSSQKTLVKMLENLRAAITERKSTVEILTLLEAYRTEVRK